MLRPKPFDLIAAITGSPQPSPAAERDAVEKRRRELIDDRQTFDARKQEQMQNELRRQSYRQIDQMDFSRPNPPVRYTDELPAREASEAPLGEGMGSGAGGPEDPNAKPSLEEIRAELARRKQPAQASSQADEIRAELKRRASGATAAQPSDDINASINEVANEYPGGYNKWRADSGLPARDPLAPKNGSQPAQRPRDFFDAARSTPQAFNSQGQGTLQLNRNGDTEVVEATSAEEPHWNEQIADILGKGVDFMFEPINSRDTGGHPDIVKGVSKAFAEPMARLPEAVFRDPNQAVQDYDPFHQIGYGYNNIVDAGGDAIEGDFSSAGKKALEGATQLGAGGLGVLGLKGGGAAAPRALAATDLEQAILGTAKAEAPASRAPTPAPSMASRLSELGGMRGVPPELAASKGAIAKATNSSAVPQAAPVREPSAREAGKTLATTIVPGRKIRPQAIRALENILVSANIPRDRIATGLTRIVESLKSLSDNPTARPPMISQLLAREFEVEFPEIRQQIGTVLQERRLTKKRNDASPTIIRDAVQDMRGSQVPFLEQSATRNLGTTEVRPAIQGLRESQVGRLEDAGKLSFGEQTRLEASDAIEANLRKIGEEGYEPFLAQQVSDHLAEDIAHTLHGPSMGKLMEPLEQIAAGEGKSIDTMIAHDPLRAAHWMQHKARLLAASGKLGYDGMRRRILSLLDDLKGPDGRTYADLRKEYGDEFLTKEALTSGDNFGTAVRNPDGMNRFVETFEEMGQAQQKASFKSIRDWVYSRLRGGQEDAPARIDEMTQRGVLDALDRLGPDGKSFAEELRAMRRENMDLGTIEGANKSFSALVTDPGKMADTLSNFGKMSEQRQDLFLGSVRDWALGNLRGGGENAPARISHLSQRGVLEALDNLGPKAKALADDIRAVRDENAFLKDWYPTGESQTVSNAVALAEGPDIYSRAGAGGGSDAGATGAALADAALMAGGAAGAPVMTAMRLAGKVPKAHKAMRMARTATREDMTRVLTARPSAGQNLAEAIEGRSPRAEGGGQAPAALAAAIEGDAPQIPRNPVTQEERDFLMNAINGEEPTTSAFPSAPTAAPKAPGIPNGIEHAILGGGGAIAGWVNPVDANDDGVIDDTDREMTAMALGLGGMTLGGVARAAMTKGGGEAAGAFGASAKNLPWAKRMEEVGFDEAEVKLAHSYMLQRFEGKSTEQIAERMGVPPDSLAGRVADIQERLNAEGVGVDLNAVKIAPDLIPKKRAGPGEGPARRQRLEEKDLIIGYNDGDSALNLGLDLNLPDEPNIASRVSAAQTRLRTEAKAARDDGRLETVARRWGVTPDEVSSFIDMRPRPNAGNFQRTIERIVNVAERAQRAGGKTSPVRIAERLGLKPGSVNVMLSQARTGARAVDPELLARVKALQFDRGRPSSFGAFGANAERTAPAEAAEAFNLIEDATQGNLTAMQKAAVDKGQVPPIFKTFRLPDGRIIAWNGDEARGGFNHDQAREVLGLGNMRLEHGQFKWGDKLDKTNWYDVTGEGQAPRSVKREVERGAKAGKDPNDIVMDMTPEEWLRDLRGIGAKGPGNRVTDYSKRRELATDPALVNDGQTIKWDTPGGDKAQISFGSGGRPDVEQVQFRLNGKTSNSDGTNFIPPGEAKATFEKAMSVLEREVIKRDKDVYIFDGATPAHNRFYASATKRLGAPQGYVAVLDVKNGNFAFIKQSRFDSDVAANRIDPKDWTVISSKRGDQPVPEWRKRTGLFAVPAGAGLAAAAQGRQDAEAQGSQVAPDLASIISGEPSASPQRGPRQKQLVSAILGD